MKTRIIALSALAMLVSACATAVPIHQPLPQEARTKFTKTDVVVPISQSEITILVPPSQVAMYGGGGLLLALIDAGIDSSNAATVEEAAKPLRTALVDFNFDDEMRAGLQTAFTQSPWLNAGTYTVVKEVTDAKLDGVLDASTSSGVLFVTANYNLNWSGDALTVNIMPHLFPKTAELTALVPSPTTSGPKTSSLNALYRNVFTFRDRAPNGTDARETNLPEWEAANGAAMRASLKKGAAKLAELLSADLHEPLAPIDEKTTKLPKIVIDGATGYVVKADSDGTLVQFATGTQMYVTRAALAPLPKGDPSKAKKS